MCYVFGIIGGLYVIIAFAVFVYLLRPVRRNQDALSREELGIKKVDAKLYEIDYSDINLKSDKGYPLYGRLYAKENSSKYAVILHGHNSASSGCVRFMKILLDRGYNVVLPDHRYSAKSGGRTITYGHQEKYDAIKFIDYIKEINPNAEIGIMGESMGGATALMVTSLCHELKFCIDYCGYAELDVVLKQAISRLAKPALIFYPLIKLFFSLFAGFSICSIRPMDAAKQINCPVLILHSKADNVVPFSEAEKILANLNNGSLYAFEDAPHGLSLTNYPKEFIDSINCFLDDIE